MTIGDLPSRVRYQGVVALSTLVSLSTAWLLIHQGVSRAAFAAATLPAIATLSHRPINGLVGAAALILIVPYWTTLGSPQADVSLLAALGALATAFLLAPHVGLLHVNYVDCAVVAFVATALLSWFVGPHLPNALQATVAFVFPFTFYFAGRVAGRVNPQLVQRVIFSFATGAAMTILYEALITHQPLFSDPKSYLWKASSIEIFRPGGVFGSPPAAAGILAMAILCGLPLLGRARGSARFLTVLGMCISGAALIATFTRAAMVGLGVGVFAYVLLLRPTGRTVLRLVFASAVLALAFTLLVRSEVERSTIYQRGVLRQGDLAARESYWREAHPLITNSWHHLLVGHGINSLIIGSRALPGQRDPDLAAAPLLVAHGTHSQYVRTLFEEGLAGLVLLLVWLGGAIVRGAVSVRRLPVGRQALVASYSAALLSLMIVSLAGDSLRHPGTLAIAALLTGLLVAQTDAASLAQDGRD